MTKPKFKVGQGVVVDNFDNGKIADCKQFRKNGKIFFAYKIVENILPGFWVEELRLQEKPKALERPGQ